MSHQTWMLVGGMIGVLGGGIGIALFGVGANASTPLGTLLLIPGAAVAAGTNAIAFRIFKDHRAGARRRSDDD